MYFCFLFLFVCLFVCLFSVSVFCCCLKINTDRLQENFASLQRKHKMLLTTVAQKEQMMAKKHQAAIQTISQLKQQLRDLTQSYQKLKTDETRLRVTLQDADFDLRDDMRLITQLQNRSKSQESVLRATTAVATELHEKTQVIATPEQ